tara:strand:+ start:2651 stop:3385 length:735 start_codon:yes stop_codon:yes gene_type:complete
MNGIIYIAFNDAFVKEAMLSAESVKRFRDIPITLFTNQEVDCEYIDNVSIIKPNHIRSKVDYITTSPYDKTLYLDSDTVIMRDISDMFEILDRFDVGAIHDYARKRQNYCHIEEYNAIPYSFSEVNGGIMSFNNSERSQEFLKLWQKKYYQYQQATSGWDQVSLRIALWQSEVKIHHYPIEYNIRPSSIREKVKNNKSQLGSSHLEPRIYHMHYDNKVHIGEFDIKSLSDLENIVTKNAENYRS